jgi:glycine hydroxymethyltransferase
MLDKVNITCNKNGIPYDTKSPFVTSGIRLGTPAVTTRGMNADDMRVIADAINLTVRNFENNAEKVKGMVRELVTKYPVY